MTFEDLRNHIPHQNRKIQELIDKGDCFSDLGPCLRHWGKMKDSLWGKELEYVRAGEFWAQEKVEVDDKSASDEPPSAVVKLPGLTPRIWNLDNAWVLIRSEYEEAKRAALSANTENAGAFIVTGQPGIGPSLSVPYPHPQNLTFNQENLCF